MKTLRHCAMNTLSSCFRRFPSLTQLGWTRCWRDARRQPHRLAKDRVPIGLRLALCLGLGISSLSLGLRASSAMGLPTNVCSGGFCGITQAEIWDRFQHAPGLDINLIPSVYSGACYHKSEYLDPHRSHYGGVLIDTRAGQVVFDGRFSFFPPHHPYAQLTVQRARERFSDVMDLDIYESFAVAETTDTIAPYRYWFRQDEETGRLLVVGYFGFKHTILCDLERHAN